MATDQAEAERVKVVVTAEEQDVKEMQQRTKAIADDAKADLDEALPALNAAIESLQVGGQIGQTNGRMEQWDKPAHHMCGMGFVLFPFFVNLQEKVSAVLMTTINPFVRGMSCSRWDRPTHSVRHDLMPGIVALLMCVEQCTFLAQSSSRLAMCDAAVGSLLNGVLILCD